MESDWTCPICAGSNLIVGVWDEQIHCDTALCSCADCSVVFLDPEKFNGRKLRQDASDVAGAPDMVQRLRDALG